MHDNETMPFDWSCGGLAEGLRCYHSEEFFEAHEHWEGVWLQSAEPEKTFLQALIQITAAFHHFRRKNHAGTASLLKAALRKLDRYPAEYDDISVEALRTHVRAWVQALSTGDATPRLPFPRVLSSSNQNSLD